VNFGRFCSGALKALKNIAQGKRPCRAALGYECETTASTLKRSHMTTRRLRVEVKFACRFPMRGQLACLCDPFRVENKVLVVPVPRAARLRRFALGYVV
jgi:hypothetical protein